MHSTQKFTLLGILVILSFAQSSRGDVQGPKLTLSPTPMTQTPTPKKKKAPTLLDRISELLTSINSEMPDLRWGANPKKSEDPGAMNSETTNNKNGSGKNTADKPANAAPTSAGTESLVFRDNTPKGQDPGEARPSARGGDAKAAALDVGTGAGGGKQGGKAFAKWWPMCLLLDPGVPDPEGLIKGMIEIAKNCEVNLVVYPATLRPGYPDSAHGPNGFVDKELSTCNLQGTVPGATAGSVLMVHQNIAASADMCKLYKPRAKPTDPQIPDPDQAAGCDDLRKGIQSNPSAAAQGLFSAKGPISTGVITPNGGWNAEVAMHEVAGHGVMGELNGSRYGLGIGYDPVKDKGTPFSETNVSGNFNQAGCIVFQNAALPNDGRWKYDPTQPAYRMETDPAKQLELGDPLFGPPSPPPPDVPPRILSVTSPPSLAARDELFFKDDAQKADGGSPDPLGPGHKKGAAADTANTSTSSDDPGLIISLRRGGRSLTSDSTLPAQNGEKGNGQDSASLTFNDDAKKDGTSQGTPTAKTAKGDLTSKGGKEGGSSDPEDQSSDAPASMDGRRGKKVTQAPRLGGSLDDDFFNFMVQQKTRRRKKGSTLRANQNLPQATARMETQ
jgi:hypothetical protein